MIKSHEQMGECMYIWEPNVDKKEELLCRHEYYPKNKIPEVAKDVDAEEIREKIGELYKQHQITKKLIDAIGKKTAEKTLIYALKGGKYVYEGFGAHIHNNTKEISEKKESGITL